MKKWIFVVFAILILALGGLWTFTNGFQTFTQPNTKEWQLTLPDISKNSVQSEIASPTTDSIETAQPFTKPEAIIEETVGTDKDIVKIEVSPEVEAASPTVSLPESGTLVFQIRGKNQGQETYQFSRRPDGGFQVFAEGKLKTEFFFIPFSLAYRQLLHLNEQLYPTHFVIELKGPFGFGNQHTRVELRNSIATLNFRRKQINFSVPDQKLAIINMFSTFSLFPQLFELGAPLATFNALDAGGFNESGMGFSGSEFRLGRMALQRLSDLQLQTAQGIFFAQRYLLKIAGPQDDYQLLFYEGRWIGVVGEVADYLGGLFIVYRSDLYPEGLEILSEPF